MSNLWIKFDDAKEVIRNILEQSYSLKEDTYENEFENTVEYLFQELEQKCFYKVNFLKNWIKCSDQIPDKKGYYLTSTIYDQVYCDYWNGINFDRTEMVVAWMPLPEPYKRGDEE